MAFTYFHILVGITNHSYQISSCYRTVLCLIWVIFSDFLIFCNLIDDPLGKGNNSKIRETRKIHGKLIKFGCKMLVKATSGGYAIQFCPYQGANTSDNALGLGGSVVSNLISCLPCQDGSMYHIV